MTHPRSNETKTAAKTSNDEAKLHVNVPGDAESLDQALRTFAFAALAAGGVLALAAIRLIRHGRRHG